MSNFDLWKMYSYVLLEILDSLFFGAPVVHSLIIGGVRVFLFSVVPDGLTLSDYYAPLPGGIESGPSLILAMNSVLLIAILLNPTLTAM